MTIVFALALVAGVAVFVAWLMAATLASNPASTVIDPLVRFGRRGRDGMLALLGFGLGGMSASFAGWTTGLAVLAAVGGAAFVVVSSRLLNGGDAPGDGAAGS